MQYGAFRQPGCFIGSRVVEAGRQAVIEGRCKQADRFCGPPGARNILALRCIHANRRLLDYWRFRLDRHAARNDALPPTA